jgi:predicted nucleic acid-binding Zn ribbon protein
MQDESKSRGYWTTPSEIQERIKERQRMKSRDALILFAVVAFGMAVMVGLIFYLI